MSERLLTIFYPMLCLSGLKHVPLLMKMVGTVYTLKEKPVGTAQGMKEIHLLPLHVLWISCCDVAGLLWRTSSTV